MVRFISRREFIVKLSTSTAARQTWFSHWVGIKGEYNRPFQLLWLSFFIVAMGWGLTMPLFTIIIVRSGATYQQLGIIQAFAALATILTQVGIGKTSDRLGKRKPLVVAGLLLTAPVVFLFPRVESLLAFAVLLALHNITYNSYRMLNSAWVTSWTDQENMGRTHGAFRIAGSLGWILASPFLGVLLDSRGYTLPFTIGAGIYLLMALAIGAVLQDTSQRSARDEALSGTEKSGAKSALPSNGTAEWTTEIKLFLLALVVFGLSQSMGYNLNSVFLAEELGVSNTQFGWLTSLQAWLEVPLMVGLGIISDKFNPALILGLSMFISGVRWILLSLATQPGWVYGIQMLNAIGITVTEVLAVAFIARLVARDFLATFMGWKLSTQSLATLLAPVVGGNIAHYLGIRFTFQIAGVLALLSCILIYTVHRSVERGSSPRVARQ
jgi:oligosaccharide:H+ symporter